ncbi:chemotaxis protein CheW [Burkholderia sp. AU39826]|uniref:chemotaxis protein CheW n=1 Tax=Burkholderia sp. AU39826 TaxID=2879634 RepID=UPI001CF14C13|nr:chemotaxis protein CheW [Burkholderia sp. AU39826]MCA7972951.1 chemotaxis protein CheW [Burkholderia sp. AU39826]
MAEHGMDGRGGGRLEARRILDRDENDILACVSACDGQLKMPFDSARTIHFLEHDMTQAVDIAASTPVCDSAGDATTQVFVAFVLGDDEYGIDIMSVREIRPYVEPTPAADAPPFVRGTIDLRGLVMPIVDLRMTFSLDPIGATVPTAIIVLNGAEQAIGLIVDSVSSVVDVALSTRRPAPEARTAMQTELVTGLATYEGDDGEQMLALLDIDRLMETIDVGARWNRPSGA